MTPKKTNGTADMLANAKITKRSCWARIVALHVHTSASGFCAAANARHSPVALQ